MNDAIINSTVRKGRLRSTVVSIFQGRCHRDEMIPSQFSDGKTKAQRNQVPYQRCQRESKETALECKRVLIRVCAKAACFRLKSAGAPLWQNVTSLDGNLDLEKRSCRRRGEVGREDLPKSVVTLSPSQPDSEGPKGRKNTSSL